LNHPELQDVNGASQAIATESALSSEAGLALDEHGFVVLPGAVPAGQMEELSDAYDRAVASAASEDMRVGSTSTRVSDFVNRGAEFDSIYVFPPLLAACQRIIGNPFKLSSFVARTVTPCVPAQGLHVDVHRDSADWPLVGFILMIDAFRPENGATCFVPGSHRWSQAPAQLDSSCEATVQACGAAGSMLIFNGSAWHGHAANTSDRPRRSLQGAFIPRAGRAATAFAARMRPETRARLGSLALNVLAI
jgi:Phytanoyl-CoA dioxygenase (PhyH)